MNILLVYGTTEGQTEKIARFLAARLSELGHQTMLANAAGPAPAPAPDRFDAVIISASLHAGRYQAAIIDYVRNHRAALDPRPNTFISVSLAAASTDEDDQAGLRKCIANFTHETGWTPRVIHHVAGAFRYTSYDFMKRWAMKYIAYRKGAPTDTRHDHELTDWEDLRRFADTIAAKAPL